MKEEDFILELSKRSLNHIIEEIYIHLTFCATDAFKKVSPEWKEIIKKVETSNVPRLQQIEDRKVSNGWKNKKPFLKSLHMKYLLKTHDCQILLDENQIIIFQCGSLFFFNASNLKLIKRVNFKTVQATSFVINSNHLAVEVFQKGTNLRSLYIWERCQACLGQPFVLPWVNQSSFNLSVGGDILNRVIREVDNSYFAVLETWNITTNSLQVSRVFKTHYVINKARPIMDGSDHLLIASVQNVGQIKKHFYSRCSEKECLWKIEKNSFKFKDWNSKFLLLNFGPFFKVINLTNGKVEQTLDYSTRFMEIRSACIQGGRVAVNGVTVDSKNDVFIEDWRTGKTLAKCGRMLNFDLKSSKLFFHFGKKNIALRRGGQIFVATIEEREVSARGSIRPCLTWMSRNCFQKARTEDLSQTQTPVGKIRDDKTEAKKIIQTTEQKCFSFQNVRLKMKPEKLVDKNSNFQRAVDTKCSFDRKPDLHSLTSGITVASECKEVFENLKMLKNLRYIIYFIKDLREINVKSTGARNADFDQFLNNLKKGGESECRYGLYDFEYNHQYEGTTETFIKKEKLFLMSWCPDTAKVRQKVVYSASFDVLKKALVGVQKYIQATDAFEASRESVEEKLRCGDRT